MAQESEDKFFENLAKFAAGDAEATFAAAPAATRPKPANHVKTAPKKPEKEVKEQIEEESEGQLTIDVYQTSSDIIVESAVAGVEPDEIDVSVSSDSVTVRGERRRSSEIEENDYLYQECYWGKFSRSVILPQEIDPDAASVTFKNGILRIRLPKLNKQKIKKLKVKVE